MAMQLFSFLMKRLLMNLFQGQFVPLHYASPTVHRFTRKIHAHVREQKISCLFFFEVSKKNCHRHVNGFGDISFISLVCNRAKNSKKLLFIQ